MAKLIGNAPNQVPTNADLGSMAFEDRTNYATVGSSIHQPFRNIIINGDMSIAQRGTSTSGITSAPSGTVHSVDRMALALESAGTWTVSQETDVPSGQGFAKSLKFLCTTNEPSIGASGYITFIHKFEGQNLQYLKYGTSNAQSLTASFWIKSSKTGNFVAELANRDNSRYIARVISINNADTWEKKTVTYEGYTTANFDNDNAWSMDLQIWFGSGTGFTSGTYSGVWQSSQSKRASGLDLQLQDTTNANVYITGVQLEAGTTASDFEFLPHDVNLQRCQRYCQVYGGDQATQSVAVGAASSATGNVVTLKPLVKFRTTPSASVSAVADFNYLQLSPFATANLVSFSLITANSSSDYVYLDLGISGATANSYQIIRTTNINARLTLNAEL